jgi:glycolate oxidase iron-sulfur subunit
MNQASPLFFPIEDTFKSCIHCGICLSACPTYVSTGDESQSPRGRIHLSQAVHEGRLPFLDLVPAMETCLGCLACESACPSQVPYHHVLEDARFKTHQRGQGRFSLLAKLIQWILAQDLLLQGITQVMKQGDRLGIRALMQAPYMPKWINQKSRFWGRLTEEELYKPLQRTHSTAALSLHLGCIMKHLMPDVHNACYDVLMAMGFSTQASPLQCCGALAMHHGLEKETRHALEKNATLWQNAHPNLTLSNAGGCGAMLKDYAHISQTLGMASPAFNEISENTQDIHEFIAAHRHKLPALALKKPTRVTYQASCHLTHAQGIEEAPLSLLKLITNLTLIPMNNASSCCGSAGIYNLEYPDLAESIAQEKVNTILATGAEVVVVGNPGCLIQLAGSLATYAPQHVIEVLHPIQLLQRGLTL